jgi:glycosyltransferase involved in cell wall biosynthesis
MARVVFNGRFLTQTPTGVQRYAQETLLAIDRQLQRQPLAAASLRLQLAVPAGARALPLQTVETRVLPRGRGHVWEQTSLAWFARDALLINFNDSGPLLKRRQLITLHDAAIAMYPQTFSRSYRLLHHALTAVLSRRAEHLMTVSHFSQADIARHFGIRRPMTVGREGWEHALSRGDDGATLAKYGLRRGQYILAVGSTKPNKNFGLLGRALDLLPEFPMPVAIAGARDARVFRPDAALPPHVQLLGFVSDAELGHLYRNAAWFVFPSLYEGFGLPALEAMANGCPVLAAQAASIPEVCGDAALYFDPNDPAALAELLQTVVTQPQLRHSLQQRAQHRLARYTWRANAMILLDLIRRLTSPSLSPDLTARETA